MEEEGGITTATEGAGGQEGGGKSGGITLSCRGTTRKRPRTERSDTETEVARGETGPSQLRYKKGHITNVYLTDSDKEAIVDCVKDHEELYKTSEHFKDKARKELLWEEFERSHKLSWCASPGLTRTGHITGS